MPVVWDIFLLVVCFAAGAGYSMERFFRAHRCVFCVCFAAAAGPYIGTPTCKGLSLQEIGVLEEVL
jgi:hypothetical protein